MEFRNFLVEELKLNEIFLPLKESNGKFRVNYGIWAEFGENPGRIVNGY